ncbi:hypothetical protein C8R45DRAFT_1047471 [Mycena sanguinolenta]|nr:hypothetical protein C8R45DRAFT_1047471 [Mycena sanguinolenta]
MIFLVLRDSLDWTRHSRVGYSLDGRLATNSQTSPDSYKTCPRRILHIPPLPSARSPYSSLSDSEHCSPKVLNLDELMFTVNGTGVCDGDGTGNFDGINITQNADDGNANTIIGDGDDDGNNDGNNIQITGGNNNTIIGNNSSNGASPVDASPVDASPSPSCPSTSVHRQPAFTALLVLVVLFAILSVVMLTLWVRERRLRKKTMIILSPGEGNRQKDRGSLVEPFALTESSASAMHQARVKLTVQPPRPSEERAQSRLSSRPPNDSPPGYA